MTIQTADIWFSEYLLQCHIVSVRLHSFMRDYMCANIISNLALKCKFCCWYCRWFIWNCIARIQETEHKVKLSKVHHPILFECLVHDSLAKFAATQSSCTEGMSAIDSLQTRITDIWWFGYNIILWITNPYQMLYCSPYVCWFPLAACKIHKCCKCYDNLPPPYTMAPHVVPCALHNSTYQINHRPSHCSKNIDEPSYAACGIMHQLQSHPTGAPK